MIPLAPYREQTRAWPPRGRVVLASFDATSVVVYQAYRKDIADYALAHGRFGGAWSRTRMSWVKPGFLWMMYRSGWGTKTDQERVLGVRVARVFFDEILARAVPTSTSLPAGEAADVRVQWDPDHDPSGAPLERRAIQLGLRGATLARYADEAIITIEDMTPVVEAGRGAPPEALMTPLETPYPTAEETHP